MKNEKLRDISCKIFCIYFGKNSNLRSEGKKLLKQIAQIGQTDNYYNPNSLESLYETFDKISNAIQTNYKLKLYK